MADLEALLDGSLSFDGLSIDQDLRWTLVTGLAAAGRADDARIQEELGRDNTISGQEHAAGARAARPTEAAKAAAWEAAVVRTDTPNETQRSIAVSFQRAGQEAVLTPYIEKYLAAAEDLWEHLGTHKASVSLEALFPRPLASPELAARLDTWLSTSSASPAAKRFVREGRADVARYLKAQACDAEAD